MKRIQFGFTQYKNTTVNNLMKRSFSTNFQSDPLIDVKDAYELYKGNKSVFLDVRDPECFRKSHIPGARSVNEIFTYLAMSDTQGIKEMTSYFEKVFQNAGLTGNEHIITYEDCLKTRFGASCRGYFLLRLFGHKNVNVLNGGWDAWEKNNYPTSTEVPEVTEGTFKPQWNGEIFAGRDEVLNSINKPGVILLDVRDQDEWQSESSSPYGKDYAPRKGRIPGAQHILWTDMMTNKDGLTVLKEPAEVEKLCEAKGITKDHEVIIYCFKGARASNTFIAMQRAGYNVKNYFASWNEWSRDHSLPMSGGKP